MLGKMGLSDSMSQNIKKNACRGPNSQTRHPRAAPLGLPLDQLPGTTGERNEIQMLEAVEQFNLTSYNETRYSLYVALEKDCAEPQGKFYRVGFRNLNSREQNFVFAISSGFSVFGVLGMFLVQYLRVGLTKNGDYVTLI